MNIVKKKSAECARMVSVRVPAALLDEFESLRERFDDAGYSIRITDVVVDAIKQAVRTLPRQLVKLQASTAVNTDVNTGVCTDGITECQFEFKELSQPPVPAAPDAPEPAETAENGGSEPDQAEQQEDAPAQVPEIIENREKVLGGACLVDGCDGHYVEKTGPAGLFLGCSNHKKTGCKGK